MQKIALKFISMHHKSILYTILFTFAMFFHAKAQQNYTLYNMNSISQSIYCNPSVFPVNNVNIGLPGLSSNYIGVTNTAFRYHDLIYKRPDDSLVFDMNNAISKMADNNYLLAHAQIDILSVGFKIKKNYFNITAIEKINGTLNYSKGLIDFLWNGNGPSIGETINIGLGLKFTHYREYGINYVRKINKKLNVGIKLKYLYGMENIQTEKAAVSLYTDPTDYSLKAQSDILINKSLGYDPLRDNNFNFQQYAFKLKNTGEAIDLGAQYQITNKIAVNISFIDFGGINWKSNVENYQSVNPNATYNYAGLNIDNVINDTTTIGEAFNAVIDSAYSTFVIDTSFNNYRTKLNKQIYLGGTYQLTKRFQTNLLLHGLFLDGKLRPGVSASIGGKLGELVHLNLCYSVFNKSYNNLGFGLSINTRGGTQFYAVSDNVLGAIFPQNAKSLNLRIGINLRFGKDPYTDDEDADGVKDIDDKCPKAKGTLAMNGCPDSDSDGIADYEDQCPDELGLPKFKGCPDKDGDNVIDKFDKCPAIAGSQRTQGCPDRDDDGLRDDEDLCPDVKGSTEMKGCPDTDADGINDSEDKCPNDVGTRENLGCPVDKDKDGVPDVDDLCPTEQGTKENKGCPDKDSDGDGLLDKDDECPKDQGNAANHGCPEVSPEAILAAKLATESTKFETGKAELLSVAYEQLDKLAQILKANTSLMLKMDVHTDNSMSNELALALTKERSNMLNEYFSKKEIDTSRLKITPFGDTKTIADNTTAEGKEKNNRVEVSFAFKPN